MEKTIDPRAGHTCSHCKYFDKVPNIEAQRIVTLCRRNAPSATAQLAMMPNPQAATRENPQGISPQWSTFTLWPIVGPTDWCGEWALDQARSN